MLDSRSRQWVQPFFDRLAQLCMRCGVTPFAATLAALALGVAAAWAVWAGHLLLGILLLWLSGLFDVLDGSIARLTGQSSALGTLLDIVFDRVVEIMALLAVTLAAPGLAIFTALVFASIILSMTVFLTVGAVAEKTGVKSFYYQPGLVERTEGFIMISLAIALPAWRVSVLVAFAVLILFTAGQRFAEAVKILK
ncbi:MAG: phosphatidylglycerophosphate synthase [Bacillota bacterium]|nr:MAG: phosphatidylglycerophosphate synthase [Bacillota bacterium]